MSADPVSPPSAPPPAPSTPAGAERTASSLLGGVIAQASFLVAVMYFLGAVYMTAYYSYFRVDSFTLGFGFAEMAIQSLNVVTAPLAIVSVLAVLALRHLATTPAPAFGPAARSDADRTHQQRLIRTLRSGLAAVARAHLYLVGAGLILLLLWSWLGEYRWMAPILLAVGVLLGQSPWARNRAGGGGTAAPSDADGGGVVRTDTNGGTAAPSGTHGSAAMPSPRAVPPTMWSRAVPVFTAGLLVMWGLSLGTAGLGEREARQAAANLVRRPSVVLLSTDRISLAGPGVEVSDLGAKVHYRYRYTGLRRLIERNGRYYLLPLGWNHQTGPTYVIQESDDLRVELFPGTRDECGAWCTEG
ncbi:hypothetical protein ACGFOU_16425 [Streptomyces sp. NPDC048595]|uniref:hypothetical protein n=1 Tax=Streptomyces sp. NPDC048595 TaxID=3365576 RepID=UPI003713F36C